MVDGPLDEDEVSRSGAEVGIDDTSAPPIDHASDVGGACGEYLLDPLVSWHALTIIHSLCRYILTHHLFHIPNCHRIVDWVYLVFYWRSSSPVS